MGTRHEFGEFRGGDDLSLDLGHEVEGVVEDLFGAFSSNVWMQCLVIVELVGNAGEEAVSATTGFDSGDAASTEPIGE